MKWEDPETETPAVGAMETWEIYNFTVDAHPIHIHEVFFEVVNRQRLDKKTGLPIQTPGRPSHGRTATRTLSSLIRARSPASG